MCPESIMLTTQFQSLMVVFLTLHLTHTLKLQIGTKEKYNWSTEYVRGVSSFATRQVLSIPEGGLFLGVIGSK